VTPARRPPRRAGGLTVVPWGLAATGGHGRGRADGPTCVTPGSIDSHDSSVVHVMREPCAIARRAAWRNDHADNKQRRLTWRLPAINDALGIAPPIGGAIPSLRRQVDTLAGAEPGSRVAQGAPGGQDSQRCLKFFDIFDLRAEIHRTADSASRSCPAIGRGNWLPVSISALTEFIGIGDVTLWRVRWHATM